MPIQTPLERLGTVIRGRLRLDRILGEGGMGVVYEGMELDRMRPVAVKFLRAEYASRPDYARRFLNEARAAATLGHANVVDIFDTGTDVDGSLFLVMELLDGESLAARMHRAPLDADEIWTILRPVMDALAHAHAHRIIHRDLKPDNVFLHRDRGVLVPKVLDFGIAKFAGADDAPHTRTGSVLGTVTYMAPEQARGKNVGPWCDVWSMGVLFYELLSGFLPYDTPTDDSAAEMVIRLCTTPPRPIREVAPFLPESVVATLDRALEHDWELRYRDMAEMLAALDATVGKTLETEGKGPLTRTLPISIPPTRMRSGELDGPPTEPPPEGTFAETMELEIPQAPKLPREHGTATSIDTPLDSLRRRGVPVGVTLGVVCLLAAVAGAAGWALFVRSSAPETGVHATALEENPALAGPVVPGPTIGAHTTLPSDAGVTPPVVEEPPTPAEMAGDPAAPSEVEVPSLSETTPASAPRGAWVPGRGRHPRTPELAPTVATPAEHHAPTPATSTGRSRPAEAPHSGVRLSHDDL